MLFPYVQMNKAIAVLPEIQGELDYLNEHALPEFLEWKKTQPKMPLV